MVELHYRLESRNAYDVVDPAARWDGALGAFDCSLVANRLVAADSTSPTVATARAGIEPHLRDWEAVAWLRDSFEADFRYDGAANHAPDAGVFEDRSGAETRLPADAGLIVVRHRSAYPAPDPSFRRTELVTSVIGEIQGFATGRAPLEEAVARILELLRSQFADAKPGDGHAELADRLNVDDGILTTLHDLAKRPDVTQASRGAPKYRGPEWLWMQEAIRGLALQAGRAGGGPPPVRLAIDDL